MASHDRYSSHHTKETPKIRAPADAHLARASCGVSEHGQTSVYPSRNNAASGQFFRNHRGEAYSDEEGERPPLPPRPAQVFQPVNRQDPLAHTFTSAPPVVDPHPLLRARVSQSVTQRRAIVTEQPSNSSIEMVAQPQHGNSNRQAPPTTRRSRNQPSSHNDQGCGCGDCDCGGLDC